MLDPSSAPLLDANSGEPTQDAELARILEGCLADIEAGRAVDTERLLAEHPTMAQRLQTCLLSLNLVQQAAAGLGTASLTENEVVPVGRLGDFEIIRQAGRGGMGVVYEAKQISLGRRVALKVLPFAATLDPRQLQRFWTEAQAAALLHHAHIVPVYSVGCERGVHYYAMQFIEGQSLAEVIASLRMPNADLKDVPLPQSSPAASGQSGCSHPTLVALTTERSTRAPGYFGSIARLGVQAALALEHAHQIGVIHRDIKPANLLVDAAGDLWITDFGLARLRTHAGLTLTGDTVGTLRYMSPEQALARRALVDHRTDIYSLGATLYEALALQPAYPGDDREEILRHIALGDPPPPRRVNPSVPVDLETIVLRAMAREPEGRYATAQELADDLNRFLEHRPVLAVRPSLRERLQKWAWRHKPVLAAAASVAALAAVGLVAMTVLLWRQQAETQAALDQARAKESEVLTTRERAEANFYSALDGLNRILWELEDPRWNKIPEFAAARRELTKQALQVLQEFINDKGIDAAVRFQAGRAYESMAQVHLVSRKLDEADRAHSQAVALFDGLHTEFPENMEYGLTLGRVHWVMGNWNISLKRVPQARTEYELALKAFRQALPYDRDGSAHNKLAFGLCDCLETGLRDPGQALALSMQALALSPRQRDFWNTLGLTHFRAGEWHAGRAAIEKAMDLSAGGDARDWLILGLIDWHEGHAPEARKWYDQSAKWLQTKAMTDDLFHLWREATILMNTRWP